MTKCNHAKVIAGPRTPLAFGSAATEVCIFCGAYRTMPHGPGRWQKGPAPTDFGTGNFDDDNSVPASRAAKDGER